MVKLTATSRAKPSTRLTSVRLDTTMEERISDPPLFGGSAGPGGSRAALVAGRARPSDSGSSAAGASSPGASGSGRGEAPVTSRPYRRGRWGSRMARAARSGDAGGSARAHLLHLRLEL